jgi:hypothetical protein
MHRHGDGGCGDIDAASPRTVGSSANRLLPHDILAAFNRPKSTVSGGGMSDASAIDAASKRLALALDALEAAVERRRESDLGQEALTEQVHMLGLDRSKLASDLDMATARAKALETTNREIARRLDIAIETIRGVLESNDR